MPNDCTQIDRSICPFDASANDWTQPIELCDLIEEYRAAAAVMVVVVVVLTDWHACALSSSGLPVAKKEEGAWQTFAIRD